MIFKQELSPQNGRYLLLLCFHLAYTILLRDVSWTFYEKFQKNFSLFLKYVSFKERFSSFFFVSQIEYCVAMQAMDAILFLGKYKSKSPQPD